MRAFQKFISFQRFYSLFILSFVFFAIAGDATEHQSNIFDSLMNIYIFLSKEIVVHHMWRCEVKWKWMVLSFRWWCCRNWLVS